MDTAPPRYPVLLWLTGASVTLALAVAIRFGAALADVEVLVPDRSGGDPQPLGLHEVVVVTLGVFAVAIVAVLILDRVLHGRSRRILRTVGLLLIAASLVPLYTTELPDESRLVLTVLHLLVGLAVLRTVVRE